MRRKRLKRRLLLICAIFFLFLALSLYLFETRLAGILADTAENAVKAKAAYLINAAVLEEAEKSAASYDTLVSFEKDASGQITALKTNTVEVNRLKSKLSLSALEALEGVEDAGLNIPIGTVWGSELTAGKGPKLHVHAFPVGVIETEVHNSLTAAGINQSLHRIFITVRAEVIVVTAATRKRTSVETEVCIAETVVVGQVPYANIDVTK